MPGCKGISSGRKFGYVSLRCIGIFFDPVFKLSQEFLSASKLHTRHKKNAYPHLYTSSRHYFWPFITTSPHQHQQSFDLNRSWPWVTTTIASPFLTLSMHPDVRVLLVLSAACHCICVRHPRPTPSNFMSVKQRKYHCFVGGSIGSGMRRICQCTGAHLGMRSLGLFFFCQER